MSYFSQQMNRSEPAKMIPTSSNHVPKSHVFVSFPLFSSIFINLNQVWQLLLIFWQIQHFFLFIMDARRAANERIEPRRTKYETVTLLATGSYTFGSPWYKIIKTNNENNNHGMRKYECVIRTKLENCGAHKLLPLRHKKWSETREWTCNVDCMCESTRYNLSVHRRVGKASDLPKQKWKKEKKLKKEPGILHKKQQKIQNRK